jgi:2-polyprenyl-3-methyl-5-hydroxy-6-metoxy-1,4-benzoquinol methylase
MYLPIELRCPEHQTQLLPNKGAPDEACLRCALGCRFPIVNNIPRFVASKNYAAAFGRQWKMFQRTQLDSYTHTTIFRDRLTGALGGSLEVIAGKSVLEAGCGAGAFTEVLLAAGARVFACDLSVAVEANYANCGDAPNYFVGQANILEAPVAPHSFDAVVCLGVVQHTPSPEATIAALAGYVRPGGMLVIDHYSTNYPYTLPRRLIRPVLLRLPQNLSTSIALILSRALLPLHRWIRTARGFWRLRPYLLKVSPLVDHFDHYSHLDEKILGEWCVLNTHDTLTDYYKHMRTVEQIRKCLISCGLSDIEVYAGGNGVEARAKRPVDASPDVQAVIAQAGTS